MVVAVEQLQATPDMREDLVEAHSQPVVRELPDKVTVEVMASRMVRPTGVVEAAVVQEALVLQQVAALRVTVAPAQPG